MKQPPSDLQLPYSYPREAFIVHISDIELGERGRKDYGDLSNLSESIVEHSLIQPPLVCEHDGTKSWKLIAGGRRLACLQALSEWIPVMTQIQLNEAQQLEMELAENSRRKEMSWQEEALLIWRAHEAHVRAGNPLKSSWGCRDTGKLMGVSHSHVAHALHVVEHGLLKGVKEIMEAKNINEAYNVLLRLREADGNERLAQNMRKKIDVTELTRPPKAAPMKSMSGVRGDGSDVDDVFDLDVSLGLETPLERGPAEARHEFPLSEWLTLGDSVKVVMPSWPDECVDHIVTDPPYAIDIIDAGLKEAALVKDTHDKKENLAMFPEMIAQFWRILRPNGFCIVWYDLEHDTLLRKLMKKAGFKVQQKPGLWFKPYKIKNLSPSTNFTGNYETCLIARKGNATLFKKGQDCAVSASMDAEGKLYSNPFSKPYKVWKHFLEAIAEPGQVIADPFAGQMSCPRACINLGLIPKAVEIEKENFDHGLVVLKKLIDEMTNRKGVIT